MRAIHKVEQYTEAWWKLRRGHPSASEFHRIVTPTGKDSRPDTRQAYMNKLIAERLLGITIQDRPANVPWAERGKIVEPEAIQAFERANGLVVDTIGFVTEAMDDYRFGSSPDGLILSRDAVVEIKCPAPQTMVGLHRHGLGDDYRPQVQGHLLVGGWDTVHFYAYHPACPSFHLPTYRDRDYLRTLYDKLSAFCDLLDEETERVRGMGVWTWLEGKDAAAELPGMFPWHDSPTLGF